jgi:hypothetical protein
MAIDRIKGKIVFLCDDCGVSFFETGESDFDLAIQTFREDEEGKKWETTKDDDGQWVNYCPDCKEAH